MIVKNFNRDPRGSGLSKRQRVGELWASFRKYAFGVYKRTKPSGSCLVADLRRNARGSPVVTVDGMSFGIRELLYFEKLGDYVDAGKPEVGTSCGNAACICRAHLLAKAPAVLSKRQKMAIGVAKAKASVRERLRTEDERLEAVRMADAEERAELLLAAREAKLHLLWARDSFGEKPEK